MLENIPNLDRGSMSLASFFRRPLSIVTAAVAAVAFVVIPVASSSASTVFAGSEVRGSINAVYISAPAGTSVTLTNSTTNFTPLNGTTDSAGALVFHDVPAGKGYQAKLQVASVSMQSPPFG
ncbi:MAG: hypothetical protein WCK25_04885, partial [Actinomycetes bacterium]